MIASDMRKYKSILFIISGLEPQKESIIYDRIGNVARSVYMTVFG